MTPTIRVQPEPFDAGAEMAALVQGRTDGSIQTVPTPR